MKIEILEIGNEIGKLEFWKLEIEFGNWNCGNWELGILKNYLKMEF